MVIETAETKNNTANKQIPCKQGPLIGVEERQKMLLEDQKMSTLSSPVYPESSSEDKLPIEGGYLPAHEDVTHIEPMDDDEDEFIDVDDSCTPTRYNGDIHDMDDKEESLSGDDGSTKGLDGGKKGMDKKLYRCQHCKYVTDRKNNLKRHVITMHDQCQKTLECCDVVFKNKASLRDHVLSCHKNGYDCRICGRNFCRKALLKRHITVHSGQKDYICSVCGYATSHKSNLDRHKRRHGPKYPIDSKYSHHGHAEMDRHLKAVSPSSLSSSSPPLSKCHSFSIESLVSDDYQHSRRRIYHDPSPSVLPPMYSVDRAPLPAPVLPSAPGVPHHFPYEAYALPLKKRQHLKARYLFTKRLSCTYRDSTYSTGESSPEKLSGGSRQDLSSPPEEHRFTSKRIIKPEPVRLSQNNSILSFNDSYNKLINSSSSAKQDKMLMLSSKRLVPGLYQCKQCNMTFMTQIQMTEHYSSHDQWMPSPQRPLTLQARHKESKYIY